MEKYCRYCTGVHGLPSKVHYWKLLDSGDGFNILVYDVENHEKVINIYFKSTMAYRSINEGDRLQLWSESIMDEDVFIYTVENSDFIEYFHVQSKYIHEEEKLTHYFIVTTDDCFDIISEDEMVITITRNKD